MTIEIVGTIVGSRPDGGQGTSGKAWSKQVLLIQTNEQKDNLYEVDCFMEMEATAKNFPINSPVIVTARVKSRQGNKPNAKTGLPMFFMGLGAQSITPQQQYQAPQQQYAAPQQQYQAPAPQQQYQAPVQQAPVQQQYQAPVQQQAPVGTPPPPQQQQYQAPQQTMPQNHPAQYEQVNVGPPAQVPPPITAPPVQQAPQQFQQAPPAQGPAAPMPDDDLPF